MDVTSPERFKQYVYGSVEKKVINLLERNIW